MGNDADAQLAARALAPYILDRMDEEARDDYQSCITAGEPEVALVLLFDFVEVADGIPTDVLATAFQALDTDHKEEFRHLLEPDPIKTA
jgi:hypothetical protein